jgi:hypothetical protein
MRDATPKNRLLPQKRQHPYAAGMAVSDVRRFRADDALWDAYTAVVGEGARSADIKAYLEWRVENPDEPLPGRWRGPVRRKTVTTVAGKTVDTKNE